jgi:putative transposase
MGIRRLLDPDSGIYKKPDLKMQQYKSYHTILKQLANKGHLPDIYLNQINRTTLWRWRMEPDDKYTGKELGNIQVLEEFISRAEAQKIMRAYLKLAFALSAILGKSERISQVLKNDLSGFVSTVQRYRKNIDLKLVLRLCRVPISVYYGWRNRKLKPCETSPIGLCKKIYPHQLTSNEVVIMKKLLLDESFRFWPVCSIAFYAIREKFLSVSLSTWYLYQKKLGIIRPKLPKKKKYAPGINADRPNQVWHADITIVKTKDNTLSHLNHLSCRRRNPLVAYPLNPYCKTTRCIGCIKLE